MFRANFVVQSSAGRYFVQALQYKIELGSALCKLSSTKYSTGKLWASFTVKKYFTSSDPHHDISKQLVDTTFVWSFCHGILSGILSGSIWHSYLAFLSGILIWHSSLAFFSGILLWHSIWHSIWRSIWHSIWHIFWHSLRRLRSGRQHLAWILAVEVRQGTLGVDGRGWGPAGNTWRGFSRLRSGREHLAWILAVEVRQGTLGVDGRGWGPEEAEGGGRRKSTDIKSNNPHLAGGEKLGSALCKLSSTKYSTGKFCARFVVQNSTGKCFVQAV